MISPTGEYALRAMVFLATHWGTARTASEIGDATQVPPHYLQKILQTLTRRGLVESQRGQGGGYVLARDPAQVTAFEVLLAVEAPLQRITECPLGIREHTELCPLHRLVEEAVERMERAFAGATLASLLASEPVFPLNLKPGGKG